jgi:hypothetical protein
MRRADGAMLIEPSSEVIMRSTHVLLAALLLTGPIALAYQSSPEEKPPKNGDTIVAKGCLRGSMLEADEMGRADGDARTPVSHRFQLKGKKDLLKQLRSDHDEQVVEITGILKSNLIDTSERGAKVGNTRIVVGVQSTTQGAAAMPPAEALPVLEVKAFEGSSTSCRR